MNTTLTPDQKHLARMLKALGNPIRFQIVEYLASRQTCITNDIVSLLPLAQSTVSQHLKVLREAGLIRGEIEGPATCYCLDPQGIGWLKEQISGWLPGCDAPELLCAVPQNAPLREILPEAVRQEAIARAYLHPQMNVAEAGAGLLAEALAPRVEKVHRLDGSAAALPDASQDAIFATLHLSGCPDPLADLREMVRLLRPGGRLVILDEQAPEQMRAWLEQADLVNGIVKEVEGFCIAVGTRRIQARDSVQASYAARALSSESCCDSSSCCTPGVISLDEISSVHWDGGYTPADKAEIPAEAADFSLGCGNPLAMAGLREGETVLDIGSGGGLDAFIAARRVGETGQVIGVDMTPAMLQRARRAAKKGGFANVQFKHGYAEKLPVPDASVDVIISNCVINLAEDKGKVFREAFRVLRDGGRLEVNDMVFGGAILPAERLSAAGWAECISGALPEQEYIDLVKQAGFKDISVRRSTSHGTASSAPVYSVQVSAKK